MNASSETVTIKFCGIEFKLASGDSTYILDTILVSNGRFLDIYFPDIVGDTAWFIHENDAQTLHTRLRTDTTWFYTPTDHNILKPISWKVETDFCDTLPGDDVTFWYNRVYTLTDADIVPAME